MDCVEEGRILKSMSVVGMLIKHVGIPLTLPASICKNLSGSSLGKV